MRPMDMSKFRKNVIKNIEGISFGFNDSNTFISTGNYVLNYLISGDFNKGIPLGKVTMLAGESGAGKSFVVSGNLVSNAQKMGIFPVIIDTENALEEEWLHKLGVDTSPDKLLRVSMSMIDDVSRFISEFMKDYKEQYRAVPKEDRQKVLFIIDSLGMLLTPTDVKQFEDGDLKGDMGRKPKALTALVRNCVNMMGEWEVGLVCTNHTYASQDMFDPDDKISGGSGFVYASSIVVAMKKGKLKEDADGNKIGDVRGIRALCKIMKSRYNKPFETVEIKIPWDRGMDKYSGLIDLFEKHGYLVKDGNKLSVTLTNGEELKLFRKQFSPEHFDKMMPDFIAFMDRKKEKEFELMSQIDEEEIKSVENVE